MVTSYVAIVIHGTHLDDNIFDLQHKVGAPTKQTDEIKNEILNLTLSNHLMGDRTIAVIISDNLQFEPISPTLVNTI